MSETSAEIFAQSLPMVSNPPRSTTRTPDEVEADIVAQKDVLHRYTAALKAEGTWPPARRKAAGFAALRAVEFHLRTRVRLPQRQLIRSR
jgi:hypothetical protein